jgi:site-specific DNA-cytosine methylase
MPASGYVLVDLFCGGGGFSTGARTTGVHVVLAVDSWDVALNMHELNHLEATHWHMLLGTQDPGAFAKVIKRHVRQTHPNKSIYLHGSPPCQGFSSANRGPICGDRTRNDLTQWYLRVASHFPVWSMEQVVQARRHITVPIGAHVQVISADGIAPCIRKRMFVTSFPVTPQSDLSLLSMHDSGLPLSPKQGIKYMQSGGGWSTVVDGQTLNHRQRFELLNDRFTRLRPLTGPGYSIVATNPGMWFSDQGHAAAKVRDLTVRESCIMQGFPSNYKLGYGSKANQLRVVGNSVIPGVAEIVCRSLP